MNILRPCTISIEEWPPTLRAYQLSENQKKQADPFDDLINHQTIARAVEFLSESRESSDLEIARQIETLKYLIYQRNFVNPSRYVPTDELRQHLLEVLGEKIGEHIFRARIIAKLRDKNILIA